MSSLAYPTWSLYRELPILALGKVTSGSFIKASDLFSTCIFSDISSQLHLSLLSTSIFLRYLLLLAFLKPFSWFFLLSCWTCLLRFLHLFYLLFSTLVLAFPFSFYKLIQSHAFSTSYILLNSKPLFSALIFLFFKVIAVISNFILLISTGVLSGISDFWLNLS